MSDLEEFLGLLCCDSRIGFAVFENQLDLTAQHATGSIHFLCCQFQAPAHALANAGIGSGKRCQHANLDGLLGLRAVAMSADAATPRYKLRIVVDWFMLQLPFSISGR